MRGSTTGRPLASARSRAGRAAAATLVGLAALALGLALPGTLRANGGTVRISRAPVGPYLVTIYSSPTPLRTGELDISVLVQDSADAVLDLDVSVEARPVEVAPELAETAAPVRKEATRAQATNKLFKAAKFQVAAPGEWEFVVTVADAPPLAFRAPVTRTTLWDRPYLLALLVLAPLAALGWFLLGRD